MLTCEDDRVKTLGHVSLWGCADMGVGNHAGWMIVCVETDGWIWRADCVSLNFDFAVSK